MQQRSIMENTGRNHQPSSRPAEDHQQPLERHPLVLWFRQDTLNGVRSH